MIPAAEADELAARLLGDLRTRLGGLHIDHARRVAAAVAATGDDGVIVAALMHDAIEKGCVTEQELAALIGDDATMDLIRVLTQGEAESDDEYLVRCASNPTALVVKRADLVDKLIADDATVAADVAEQLRDKARRRLGHLQVLSRGAGPRQDSTAPA